MDGHDDELGNEESECSDENDSVNDTINSNSEYSVRLLLTNARSLTPKIDSLVEAFQTLDLNAASITETWFKGGKGLREGLRDLEGRSGIRVLHRSRDGRSNRRGGGVALAFRTNNCNFKMRNLKQISKDFEVLCAVGKVEKIERPVVIFVIYIPPDMRASALETLKEELSAEIVAVQKSYKNPLIIVNGDMNRRDIGTGIKEVADFHLVSTGPTRGDSTIDLMYTNAPRAIEEAVVTPPLHTSSGVPSDHRSVFVRAAVPPERRFRWVVQWRRTRDQGREEAFARELGEWDWARLRGMPTADAMAVELREVIDRLTDRHFPLARVRKRSNELPWITKKIRRLWKRKIRIYKKKGKSDTWWEVDRQLQHCIQESRGAFVDTLLEQGSNGSSFYSATKKLATSSPAPPWKVSDLFTGAPPGEICQKVLDFYRGIAGSTAEPIPVLERVDGGLGCFTVERTADLLRGVKKTNSRVEGDPLAHLVRKFPEAFAVPVSVIFNQINVGGYWPSEWKKEHLTIIPKTPNPADLSECRNISCTSIFSKVLEGVLLQNLRKELVPDPAQYGGTPGSGAEHLLIDIWERVITAMEGGQDAAVLLGVDYEKAFNRMDHRVCLAKLQELGASSGSVSLVRAFLEDRTMTIAIEGVAGSPVAINRGSPQGSVLGCLLYCVTTQCLTERLRAGESASRTGAFLYVDDTTLLDSVPTEEAARHITTNRTVAFFDGLRVGDDFEVLNGRANDIGMKINAKKTQLLIVCPPNGCDFSGGFTTTGGDRVEAVDALKLVGFTFGKEPGAGAHVDSIVEKYMQKKWMLHHLSEAGFKGEVLFRLYCCYVRSMIEYCSPVYHPLLTVGQEQQLERLQRHAVRACFGCEVGVEELMELHAIESLKARRERRMDRFIRKAAVNPKFSPLWFPPRAGLPMDLRNRREIQETQASSVRRFKSPLAHMRRRANDLGIRPMGREPRTE